MSAAPAPDPAEALAPDARLLRRCEASRWAGFAPAKRSAGIAGMVPAAADQGP